MANLDIQHPFETGQSAEESPEASVPALWTPAHAAELYRVSFWGRDYFDVSESGELRVRLVDSEGGGERWVSLMEITRGLEERGFELPILLRFGDLLEAQIRDINESFNTAIAESGYRGVYRGVYPIKVNQQEQVVREIVEAGRPYHFGLEAGSKAEFVAALATLGDPEAVIVINGYKDAEMIDLALQARRLGLQPFIVVETPGEVPLVIERAQKMKVDPLIGVRIKLSARSAGHWNDSGGDNSVFGLSMTQLIAMVDELKEAGYLHCLQLLHYHQGSQIPDIRSVREAAAEAARVYANLEREGAPMGFFDMGGGLAVDYDGSHSTQFASCNYSPREYAADIIEAVMRTMNEAGLEHPTLISESGRATVAHSSVLLFNVFEVTRFEPKTAPAEPAKDAPELVRYLAWVARNLSLESAQENYNDAIYYREEIRRQFQYGSLSLRHRAHADHIFWTVLARIARLISEADAPVPPELERIRDSMIDIYHVNFSVFQSLPDAWAIDQVFPVMPIHRLAEKPEKQGIMADITCDCDGKLDKFIDSRGVRGTLPLHDLKEGEDYLLGAFLVGAYQETLGDLHNLLGDTHVASVYVENGELVFEREIDGDSVADVLNYVEYDTKDLAKQFRDLAERAVRDDRITPAERREVLRSFDHALRTYTYFID